MCVSFTLFLVLQYPLWLHMVVQVYLIELLFLTAACLTGKTISDRSGSTCSLIHIISCPSISPLASHGGAGLGVGPLDQAIHPPHTVTHHTHEYRVDI
jgi:hypothetical protein